ncbi:hypothetical protein [Streptomyces sp. SID2119]|uniref:hypothetical protein n=1 Tax=Streptomyces sp. SID2119 TaxID=2690253 RepID=UPI001F39C3F4|nr:hypothetical protein [Streptomyces sp. SID2119]
MPTSDSTRPPKRTLRARIASSAGTKLIYLGATAALLFILSWNPGQGSDWKLLATLASMGIMAVGAFVDEKARIESQTRAVGESRRRLTRAEDALADAIRREYATGTGITVSGRVTHHVPPAWRAPEGEQDRSQPVTSEAVRRGVLGLPELWEATHARLDLYHQIATGQAKTSFRNAQIAMVAGFLLLVVFAGIAVWASTTAVAIVAGGLGAVAAALAGYVAKTFIRSQEAAATHLRSYFDQPLELSRYLAAERLVADGDLTQEQRGEILTALVQAMVAGPQPPAPPQAVAVVPVPGQQGA